MCMSSISVRNILLPSIRKEIGKCQVCKKPIYDDEKNIMKIFHVKCLKVAKEKKKYIEYEIPTTHGKVRVRK